MEIGRWSRQASEAEYAVPNHLYDLRHLKYAMAAAEFGSFRRAADALGVQQSEVSRRIRGLEDRLGIELFVRYRTGSKLTTVGRLFLQEAERGLKLLSHAAASAAALRRAEQGELRVGIMASLSAGSLRGLLARYADGHPNVSVSLHRGTHEEHYVRILNETIDVAFVTGTPNHPGVSSLSLWSEMKLVAVPKHHPLGMHSEISWSDLAKQRFLVPKDGPGPEIQRHIQRRLAAPGLHPDIAFHELGPDDLLHLVAMGFGIMLTSESTIGVISPAVVLLRLIDDEPLLWNAIWLSANRNQSLHSILEIARRHRSGLRQDRNSD